MANLDVVAKQWDAHLEMSLSPPAKSSTPLSPVPHVGFHDGPAGRSIVSERIGGTAQKGGGSR